MLYINAIGSGSGSGGGGSGGAPCGLGCVVE